jgi:tetratricopeptide (TPR) repeat protein
MQKSYYQQLPLLPLDGGATAEMVRDLVGDDVSVHGLAERIRERTAGNPFFIEEVVQSLVETGYLAGTRGSYRLTRPIDQVSIPATVQTVLAARIDRLGERDKTVVQTAAVIGKEFSEAILKRVGDLPEAELAASLHHLTAAEFLYEKAVYPEAEFAFRHPLTQEVAYGSPLAERRARTHAAVARAIAELYPEKLDERAALLAHHWECAGEPVEAARWHARAAEWAGINDPGEALRHYIKVRDLLGRVPESESLAPLALEARTRIITFALYHGLSDEEVSAAFIEARKLAARINDLRGLANLLTQYGTFHYLSGAPKESLAPLEEAVRLAEQVGDAALKVGTRLSLSHAYFYLGRLRDSLQLSDECLEMSRADPKLLTKIFAFSDSWILGSRGMVLRETGCFRDADEASRRCDEIAHRLGETQVRSWNQMGWATLCERSGDADGALHHGRQAVELAERSRASLALTVAYSANGLALLSNGRCREAVDSFECSLATSSRTRAGLIFDGFTLTGRARSYFGLGEAGRALAIAEKAVRVCQQAGTRAWECGALLALARIRQAAGGISGQPEIDALLRRAALLIQDTGARSYEPFLHEAYAELAGRAGDDASRERELRDAHRLFTEMGASGHAARLAKELGA